MNQRTASDGGQLQPEPESPLDLEAPDWRVALGDTVLRMKEDRVTLTAAGLAFYWFLALFPALIALVGLVSVLRLRPDLVDSLVGGVEATLPSGAAQVLTQAVQTASQQAGTSLPAIVGFAVAVWSASSGMAALQTGLNVAYRVPEDRKFVAKRLIALVLMVVTLLLGGIASALLVFGQPLGRLVQQRVALGGTAFVYGWTALRWLVTILAITALFSAFYYLGPKRPTPRWRWVSPGGLLGTGVWLAASVGFSIYVARFGSYGKTYGALAGVVVLLLWLYLTGLAVLAGGELNAELERRAVVRRSMRRAG
jgi:membrane protein